MNNEEWIGSLIEQYERPLCRYAYSLAGSISQAQDAVQETFIRLCKAERARLEGHEAPWLFRVCRSRVLDMKRKDKPVQPLSTLDSRELAGTEPSPADRAIQRDHEQALPRLMAKLPDRQAEAIRLKFLQSMSYRDIARVMKVSESNVGFLIHTGIKTMRAEMKLLQGALS